MSKKTKTKVKVKRTEDLSIPDFLLVRNRPRAQPTATPTVQQETPAPPPVDPWRRALDALEPLEFREFLLAKIRRGHFERSWLTTEQSRRTEKDVEATLRVFREQFVEYDEKQARRKEEARERLAAIPRRVSPLRGLVPIRKILEELGDKAPSRKHALAAVEAAKLVHTKYHFPDSPVTLAHVRRVLLEYQPPVAAKTTPTPSGVIVVRVKENPHRAGSTQHDRMAALMKSHGKTVAAYLEADGCPLKLRAALDRDWVTVKPEGGENDDVKTRPTTQQKEERRENRRR